MKNVLCIALVAAFAAGTANAACTYPKAPEKIPDGGSATLEEMITAQRAVKQFDADITAYQNCVETEFSDAMAKEASLTEEQKTAIVEDIRAELAISASALPLLPSESRRAGVAAHTLFEALNNKIGNTAAPDVIRTRISVSSPQKALLLLKAWIGVVPK